MKKNNIKKGISKGKMIAIGAGAAVVGAGAYYLLGPKGKEHRKKVSTLMVKMKKEVASKAKEVKDMSVPIYNKVVDIVSEDYSTKYKEYQKDIKSLAKKMKNDLKEARKKATQKTSNKSN